MIRRLIITWLVISILGYGMATAADVHYGESPADQVVALENSADLPNDPHILPAHDQCGHGYSHLLGLNFTPAKPTVSGSYSLNHACLIAWNSFLAPPLSRPPKA